MFRAYFMGVIIIITSHLFYTDLSKLLGGFLIGFISYAILCHMMKDPTYETLKNRILQKR